MTDDDPDRWHAPALKTALADLAAGAAVLHDLDGRYRSFAGRSDFDADTEREKLRPLIRAAREAQRQREVQAEQLVELERITNALLPVWRELDAALRSRVAAVLIAPEVPTREALVALYAEGVALDGLRRTLHAATGDDAHFAKRFDPLTALERAWTAEAEARERVLRAALNPSHRPRPDAPTWAADLARLSALVTTTATTGVNQTA